jgi:hypothetical protein
MEIVDVGPDEIRQRGREVERGDVEARGGERREHVVPRAAPPPASESYAIRTATACGSARRAATSSSTMAGVGRASSPPQRQVAATPAWKHAQTDTSPFTI